MHPASHDELVSYQNVIYLRPLFPVLPYWYLISRVFNFAFFAIVKKSRN